MNDRGMKYRSASGFKIPNDLQNEKRKFLVNLTTRRSRVRFLVAASQKPLFTCTLLLLCLVKTGDGQRCKRPTTRTVSVNETAPAGTVLFSVDADGGLVWQYSMNDSKVKDVMDNYLTFTKNSNQYIMSLLKPLDLEELNEVHNIVMSTFVLKLFCTEINNVINYDIFLTISPVNEFAPRFSSSNIQVYVNETSTVPVDVFQLLPWASDRDINPRTREIKTFHFLSPQQVSQNDATTYLNIRSFSGTVYTYKALDYESLPQGRKFLSAELSVKDTGGKEGTATFTLHVENVDDMPPKFGYSGCQTPCTGVYYTVKVNPRYVGVISGIQPAPIEAKDGDGLGETISYSVVQGPPMFKDFIAIASTTGQLSIIRELQEMTLSEFVLTIEAKEKSVLEHTTTTTVLVTLDQEVGPEVASASTDGDTARTVAIVLAIILFIILVLLVVTFIYCRKRYKKNVHPEESTTTPETQHTANGGNVEGRPDNAKPFDERPRKLKLSVEEPMRLEEETSTWLILNKHRDIVDLSDEDTLRWKKKNGPPPNSTHLNSCDSAFEESDKKSASEESRKDYFYPETEYAEVGTPTNDEKELEESFRCQQNVYSKDPTHEINQKSTTTENRLDEHEYLTPETARLKRLLPCVVYNKAVHGDDGEGSKILRADAMSKEDRERRRSKEETAIGGVKSKVEYGFNQHGVENTGSSSKSRKGQRNTDPSEIRSLKRQLNEGDETFEYSTPKSNRSSFIEPTEQSTDHLPSERVSTRLSDEEDRPAVPPRPKVRPFSGLFISDIVEERGSHYASVNKKMESKPDGAKNANSHLKSELPSLEPPARRKRPRKRATAKQIQSLEEDLYDGTKDYADLEMDPSFYTDANKRRIKRSSRIPVVQPDPSDIKYWITVTDDY